MVTLLDIGNSHTRIATGHADGSVTDLCSLNTADLAPGMFSGEVAAASVVPSIRPLLPPDTFFLSPFTASGVNFRHIDCSTLGADRVANAMGAAAFLKLPAAIIDCGTAITFEVVDKEKVFRGGAILPGRKLQRHALHGGTAQLPEIRLGSKLPERCGTNTVSSIALGCDLGTVGAMREIAALLKQEFGEKLHFYITGGDAPFFLAALPFLEDAGVDLTLRGLLRAYLCAQNG